MSSAGHHQTSPEDRISLGQKVAYGLGAFVNNLQAAAHGALVTVLHLGLGVDPAIVGIISFVPRIFDALSDPILGYISDHTQSRWGRRRPYIFWGAIASGLLFALMWRLPEGRSDQFYLWVCITGFSLYFVVYTLYATPFIALGYELSPDYHERTRLQAFGNAIGQIVWLAAPWIYAFLANESLFSTTVVGAKTLALWIGGAIALLGVVPAICCRENRRFQGKASSNERRQFKSASQHFRNFFIDARSVVECQPFVKLCAATFLVFNGFQLGNSFTLYVLIYYIYGGNHAEGGYLAGVYGTLTAAFSVVAISLSSWTSSRLGKRKTFMIANSIAVFGFILKWPGYDPRHPYLLLFSAPFVSCGIGSLFTIVGAMVADVCDYDELENNQRREALFGAIFWWMVKVGMAFAGLLTGLLLSFSGFEIELEAQQPVLALWFLRVFDVSIPVLCTLLAIWVVARYPISEKVAYEIRTELEQRRGFNANTE